MFDLIFAAIIGLTAILLLAWQIHKLEQTLHAQAERIAKLEAASLRRLPQRSFEELLDLKAELVILEHEMQIRMDIIKNISGHADNAMTVGTKRQK